MSVNDSCSMQYYYPTEELKEKNKIKCEDKNFPDFEDSKNFNNGKFLKFIDDKYGNVVFKGESPFTFTDDYIDLKNENICKVEEYSLKPQQKFMGQFINPATNFNNTLIFHGLGSGKTCTSLVIGEAFKTTKSTPLLYVVPAALVDQYKEEIIGELKLYTEEQLAQGKVPEIWSCTSQCIIEGKQKGDLYVDREQSLILKNFEDTLKQKENELKDLVGKQFSIKENEKNRAKNNLDNFKKQLLSKVSRTFEIISHNVFINKLFHVKADGTWEKKELLTDKNSPILNSNGILVIDEIQRLVSAGGILYKKLFTAIYQYIHPKCRIVLLSATPIYDNPYEMALTMNLLRPRVPFPLSKAEFYSFFLGKYNVEKELCERITGNNFITDDSCVINKDLLKILSSGYVSYFRGGNPKAYPYKRIITIEHKLPPYQKEQYINALRSDIKKDKSIYSKLLQGDEFLIKNKSDDLDTVKKEDSVSGIYTTTQQFCNIAFPIIKSDIIEDFLTPESQEKIKLGLKTFKEELKKLPQIKDHILNYIRERGYSEKFVKIIELSSKSNGPVFIFSNWLQFGVESLSIILEACGYKKFTEKSGKPKPGELRYFVWSSETSSQPELIRKSKAIFNSMDNKDGSLLKIILGTRSIMEGVSFKNVKQVHITDPWWNEARIEQILARAVRFCSHSNLPLNEQYTDIFRHYSVLPLTGNKDPDIVSMLNESLKISTFKNFEIFTIEQKMAQSSLKKYAINNEFEETLKEVAYDCDLNKKGNIIRLEENIRPLTNGNYQVYFKNPRTLELFVREGIPDQISEDQFLKREYSYPNDSKLPIKFYEIYPNGDNLIKVEEPEFNILEEPIINKDLTLYENIQCWDSNLTFKNILDKMREDKKNDDIISYFERIKNNIELYPLFRKEILGENILPNKIEFVNVKYRMEGKNKLIQCLTKLSNTTTDEKQRKFLKELLDTKESSQRIDSKIYDIIYKYKFLPEDMIGKLKDLALEKRGEKEINQLLEEAKNYNLLK